jgi:pimeloyl-ACP methyl ester carboxylesterase
MAGEVVAGGHRLETLTVPAGDPGAPTLVLLHEGLGSISMWRDFPQALAARTGCTVVAYSRQGHGNSAPLQGPRAVRYMHDEALVALPELLRGLGIERPVLVGHSDGASIAAIFAGAAGIAPGLRPRGLVLMAPHVFVEDLTVTSIAAVKRAYETTDLPRRLARHHADADRTFYGWNDIWLHPEFRAWNIEDYLPGILCPVLLIQGEGDEYGTQAQLAAIRRAVTASPVEEVLLPACGHSPHRDQPAATLDAIAGFLVRLRGDTNGAGRR